MTRPETPKQQAAAERKRRLAAELRANLAKRKQQARNKAQEKERAPRGNRNE